MDTWATSSLTPQIAGGWVDDDDLFQRVFPMDLRPQGHDIIRTWLFSTVVRAHFEHGTAPWRNAALSGWILDPDRKKMSKSKGNVVTPMAMLEQYGSDAVRYWSANGRPGTDTALDEGQMKVGPPPGHQGPQRQPSSSCGLGDDPPPADARIGHPVDRAMLARLATLVDQATSAFEGYDYARALERTESFFWWFCDDHVELVKGRAYGNQAATRPADVGPGRARGGARRPAPPARPDPALRHRGGVVLVAGGLDPPRPVARPDRGGHGRGRRRPPRHRGGQRRAGRDPQGQDRSRRLAAGRGRARSWSGTPPSAWPPWPWPPTTSRTRPRPAPDHRGGRHLLGRPSSSPRPAEG